MVGGDAARGREVAADDDVARGQHDEATNPTVGAAAEGVELLGDRIERRDVVRRNLARHRELAGEVHDLRERARAIGVEGLDGAGKTIEAWQAITRQPLIAALAEARHCERRQCKGSEHEALGDHGAGGSGHRNGS